LFVYLAAEAGRGASGVPKPVVVFNMVDRSTGLGPEGQRIRLELEGRGYRSVLRFTIAGYPNLSADDLFAGFDQDESADLGSVDDVSVVLVTAPGSRCGKLSTCLGAVYADRKVRGLTRCSYAKYELFPIWNLPLEHPINLAYEAATADIGDRNVADVYHAERHPDAPPAVNYNRDVEAFPVLERLIEYIASHTGDADQAAADLMNTYKSPTDMGCNAAGQAIVEEVVCARAALVEIERRMQSYADLPVLEGESEPAAVTHCRRLLDSATRWLDEHDKQ
jgi:uncharacterized protein (UPF0371 family)